MPQRLQEPQPVREALKQQWLAATAVLCLLTGLATWVFHDHLHRLVYALPLGLLVGGGIWCVALLLVARGWIAFAFDD